MDALRDSVADRRLLDRATQISRPDNGSWQVLSQEGDVVCGEFAGTAAYQVAVDLRGPRYRCTCPTPTQPCKHALALHLIALGRPDSVREASSPAWVAGLLAAPDGPAPAGRSVAGPSSARIERRYEEIDEGVRALDRWLVDLARTGVASLAARSDDMQAMSRRLWDAKAKGLARAVLGLIELPPSAGWQERTVERLGRLHLLLAAWLRRDTLEAPLVADLAAFVGVSQRKEDALAQPALEDLWDVLGSVVDWSDESRLLSMRTWLRGRRSDRYALILQQAYAHDAPSELPHGFDKTLQVAHAYEADLCFYPSACPLRAEVRSRGRRFDAISPPVLRTLAAAHAAFVDALARLPWLGAVPVLVGDLRVERRDAGFVACDGEGSIVDLEIEERVGWAVLAQFGGSPCALFGEWDGRRLRVIRPHREPAA